MISIRNMTAADVPGGMRLKTQAGWNQVAADWERMIALEPTGAFVAVEAGTVVGTTMTCTFGSIGWIAMVLVDEDYRRQGIGGRLVYHAVQYLDQIGIRTQRLDATPLGRPVYEAHGFVAEYELGRFVGTPLGNLAEVDASQIETAHAEQLEAISQLDEQFTGTPRRRMLERFFAEDPESLRVGIHSGKLQGYSCTRPGSFARQIGPIVARGPNAGLALLSDTCRRYSGEQLLFDVPLANTAALEFLQQQGVPQTRTLVRMHRGQGVVDQSEMMWGGSGPEKG